MGLVTAILTGSLSLNLNPPAATVRRKKMDLLISFPNQSESFTHGVEFGRLLEKIERGDNAVQNNGFPVRAENVELLRDTCNKHGYVPTFADCVVEGWVNFLGIKKTSTDN